MGPAAPCTDTAVIQQHTWALPPTCSFKSPPPPLLLLPPQLVHCSYIVCLAVSAAGGRSPACLALPLHIVCDAHEAPRMDSVAAPPPPIPAGWPSTVWPWASVGWGGLRAVGRVCERPQCAVGGMLNHAQPCHAHQQSPSAVRR